MYDFGWGFVKILLGFYSFNFLPVNLSIFPYVFHPLVPSHFVWFGLIFILDCVFNGMMMSFGSTFKPIIWILRCIHRFTITFVCGPTENITFRHAQNSIRLLRWETFQVNQLDNTTEFNFQVLNYRNTWFIHSFHARISAQSLKCLRARENWNLNSTRIIYLNALSYLCHLSRWHFYKPITLKLITQLIFERIAILHISNVML